MPKTVRTICVTLEPKYIDILKKIKKKEKKESISDVFRFLLNWNDEMEVEAEWKKAYEEYYPDGDPCKNGCVVFGKNKGETPPSPRNAGLRRGKGGVR